MRRYREMSALGGGMNFYGEMPESYNINVNMEHPLIKKILDSKSAVTADKVASFDATKNELQSALDKIENDNKGKKSEEISTVDKDEKERLNKEMDTLKDSRKKVMENFADENTLLKQVTDLALLANNMLKGKELNEFIKRSTEVLM